MQAVVRYITFVVTVALMTACGGVKGFDVSSFEKLIYEPQYAVGFGIRYSEQSGATLITMRNPWQGADGVEQYLLIDPKDYYSSLRHEGVQRISTPAQRVVCMSSSYVAMLSQIECDDRVVGVSGIDFISNEWVQSNRDKVGDVGYDGNTNYELLLSLKPDIVLLYGVNASSAIENKLRELSIPYAYIGEYVESSPLGKAEWLVALAEIVGCRAEAEASFTEIVKRYDSVRCMIADGIAEQRPRVMLNTPYRDSWVIPSRNNYMVRLIEDAGGVTHTIEGDGNSNSSQPIDMEQALLYANQSDMWLNVGACRKISDLTRQNPKFADVEAVRKGRVYNNNRRETPMGGSDFWESGIVRPDIVLMDLGKILHPELLPEHELYYYKRLE